MFIWKVTVTCHVLLRYGEGDIRAEPGTVVDGDVWEGRRGPGSIGAQGKMRHRGRDHKAELQDSCSLELLRRIIVYAPSEQDSNDVWEVEPVWLLAEWRDVRM